MYSAFVIGNAMFGCFLHFHEMTPTPTTKIRTTPLKITDCLHLLPNPHRKILSRQYPYFQSIAWSPKCPSNTSWCILWPSNVVDRPLTQIDSLNSPHLPQMQYRPLWLPLHTWQILNIRTLYENTFHFPLHNPNTSSENFNNFEFASNKIMTGFYISMLKHLRISLM